MTETNFCKHCGKEIIMVDGGWFHNGKYAKNKFCDLVAEQKEARGKWQI